MHAILSYYTLLHIIPLISFHTWPRWHVVHSMVTNYIASLVFNVHQYCLATLSPIEYHTKQLYLLYLLHTTYLVYDNRNISENNSPKLKINIHHNIIWSLQHLMSVDDVHLFDVHPINKNKLRSTPDPDVFPNSPRLVHPRRINVLFRLVFNSFDNIVHHQNQITIDMHM